ncbi:MAG TPA: hypothetical protein VGI92_05920 [Gemmatimonadales bacterium]
MPRYEHSPHIVTPAKAAAKAGVHASTNAIPEKWAPAFAGATKKDDPSQHPPE